jgi:hypothetical protein
MRHQKKTICSPFLVNKGHWVIKNNGQPQPKMIDNYHAIMNALNHIKKNQETA